MFSASKISTQNIPKSEHFDGCENVSTHIKILNIHFLKNLVSKVSTYQILSKKLKYLHHDTKMNRKHIFGLFSIPNTKLQSGAFFLHPTVVLILLLKITKISSSKFL